MPVLKTEPVRSRMARLLQLSMRLMLAAIVLLLSTTLRLQGQEEGKQVTIGEAVENALRQSKLTVAGGTPFHLKAHIAAVGKLQPEYAADVEEFWISPEKWRRTVKSKDFSQVLVVNGDRVSEALTGEYYPFWLHDLVTALFDPLPMAEQLKRMRALVEIPEDSTKSNSCLNMESKAGIAPAENTVTYVFCFGGKLGLLQAAVTPGYRAQFADYQAFQEKLVARSITAEFAPGLSIAARIAELGKIGKADDKQFAVDKSTPAAEQMKTSQVGEDSARVLALSTPEIVWPAVREGKTSGMLSLYISTDRSGQVREAWPMGSDNQELTEVARRQVLHWRYKPYQNNGISQMEAVLTFAFSTKIENPVAVLSNAQARKLAVRAVEPAIAPDQAGAGAWFTLRAAVDERGKVQSIQNLNNAPAVLYSAGSTALKQWRFRPYINRGKPDRFYADILFSVH